jgi:uncharacterized protein YkwD
MNRGARPAAARRARFLLAGALVLAVLGTGGFYLARDVFSPSQADGPTTAGALARAAACGTAAGASCAASPGAAAVAMSSAVVTVPPNEQAASSSPSASTKTPAATPSAAGAKTNGASTSAPAATKASAPANPTAAPPASAGAGEDATAEAQVLALINQARAAAGLSALTVTSGLETSSSAHNALMAAGCGLSHQCPGEAAIGARETAAGVGWTACGENIGEGGPVSGTAAAIAQMAVGLTQSMLDEQPPNDGHRMNILSTSYTHAGIAVYRDSSGTVWLTQDFSN